MGPEETEAGRRRRPMQECALGLSSAMGDDDSVLLGPSEGHVDGIHISIAYGMLEEVALPHPLPSPTSEGFPIEQPPPYFQVCACVTASVLPQVSQEAQSREREMAGAEDTACSWVIAT